MNQLKTKETLDDLMQVDGQAELIAGRIVKYPPAGHWPSIITGNILYALSIHARLHGEKVFTSTVGFAIPELSSGRESFSPDASYYIGELTGDGMGFIAGPPRFAVEVRNKYDYGPAAERAMADKRDDYFEAGTLAVWDVDPMARTVKLYRRGSEDEPLLLRTGEIAHAEPGVPGWKMAVDDVFEE